MILSTLAELEEGQEEIEEVMGPKVPKESQEPSPQVTETAEEKNEAPKNPTQDYEIESISDVKFLQNVRERILVLFEGFQSPNNQNIEAKVDLTLNFLEYLLASIDEQLEKRESS